MNTYTEVTGDEDLVALPCVSCERPSTHRTPDGYPVCGDCAPSACPDHFVGAETLRCETCGEGSKVTP